MTSNKATCKHSLAQQFCCCSQGAGVQSNFSCKCVMMLITFYSLEREPKNLLKRMVYQEREHWARWDTVQFCLTLTRLCYLGSRQPTLRAKGLWTQFLVLLCSNLLLILYVDTDTYIFELSFLLVFFWKEKQFFFSFDTISVGKIVSRYLH